ncbi:TNF receptor-associated factor 6-like [Dysidea avara]|uniref:TNF receptor-associated factor 6-like n=1 Tax=Dysidea avara TaxID=196820 RepID=UPI003325982E
MAVSKVAWKDIEINFIAPISDDFICSVCLSLLCEPCQSSCCGHHFCEACVVQVQESTNQCPLCRETPLNITIDKFHKRRLDQLAVYCPRKSEGCWWKGELGKVEKHLSTGQLEGECQYVEVKCMLCRQNVLRDILHRHMSYSCPNRTVSCEYCGLESTHEKITKQHFTVCSNYPLVCPNHCCSDMIQRHKMSDHLDVCPEQTVACTFSEAGCEEKMLRKQLQQHLETNVITHQTLAWKAQQKEIMAMKDELTEFKLKAGQVDYWINGFQMMAEEVKKNNWGVYLTNMSKLVTSMSPPVAPIIIHLKISSEWSHSKIFYSHSRGYKMLLCARLHQTEGFVEKFTKKDKGIEVHFCTVEGQYDSSLTWPYKGKANVTLLNKRENANHITKAYAFTANKYSSAPIQVDLFNRQLMGTYPGGPIYQHVPQSLFANIPPIPPEQQLYSQQPPLSGYSIQNPFSDPSPAPIVQNFGDLFKQRQPDPVPFEEADHYQANPVNNNHKQVHNNCRPVTPTIVLSAGTDDVTYSGHACFEVTFK